MIYWNMRILLALAFLFLPLSVFAQSIVINEIAWMGTPVEGVEEKQWWRYEWVELRNITASSVVLNGWMIELYRTELDWRVPLAGTIPAQGYFLVTASDKIPNFDVNYANLSGKFVNSGQKVVLRNSSGAVVEEVGAAEGWFGGDSFFKQTMERWDPLKPGNDPENWGTSLEAGGTPKAQNSIYGQAPYQSSLRSDATGYTKKDSFESSARNIVFTPVFLKALILALGSAAAALFLKRRLERPHE